MRSCGTGTAAAVLTGCVAQPTRADAHRIRIVRKVDFFIYGVLCFPSLLAAEVGGVHADRTHLLRQVDRRILRRRV